VKMLPPFSMVPTNAWFDNQLLESDLRVLGTLCSFWNVEDGSCFPSHATISRRTGLSNSTVKRSLDHLRDCGYVRWTPRFSPNGSQSSNDYEILNLPGSSLAINLPAPEAFGTVLSSPLAHPKRARGSSPKASLGCVTEDESPLAHPEGAAPSSPKEGDKQTNQQTTELTNEQEPRIAAKRDALVSDLNDGTPEAHAKSKAALDAEIANSSGIAVADELEREGATNG